MRLIDYAIIAVVVMIIGLAVWYIHRSKKKGVKCIGCPSGGTCSGKCTSCTQCQVNKD
jgi:hypothetical protein